jgi:AcrR family transcriptional regulator
MGRPSLAEVRKPQILDAYAAVVAEQGVEATTLDMVAERAGVTRGLVRHYLGNRDDVMRALVAHVRDRYVGWLQELIADQPQRKRLHVMLDVLLAEDEPEGLHGAATALYSEGLRDPEVAAMLREMYSEFERIIDVELAASFPEADPRGRRDVAFSIMGLAFATSDFRAIGMPAANRTASRRAANRLIESLR